MIKHTIWKLDQEEQALDLYHQYVERRMSGVLFAPLEFTPKRAGLNRQSLPDSKATLLRLYSKSYKLPHSVSAVSFSDFV